MYWYSVYGMCIIELETYRNKGNVHSMDMNVESKISEIPREM